MQKVHVIEDAPVVHLVEAMLRTAIGNSASDIHLESTGQGLRVRYRIDGILYDQERIPHTIAHQVLSRLKVLARLDITEKRIPQDGKFQLMPDKHTIDLRISTFPAIHGEKMVVRILDRARTAIKLEHLGFTDAMQSDFAALIGRSHGFFLVAGPTGSGKTTTLYASLAALNAPEKNIITLEDPVEYNVDGITQGQINHESGLTFEKGIRAILRQDPDVVMIGEVRDTQTAQIAIEAALTGHRVLSTIHTNDAPSVIVRLMDMGIEPYLINAAVSGILAQRLARMICVSCRVSHEPSPDERTTLKRLGVELDRLYAGKGCVACSNRGYKGRIGIFELLPVTNALRSLIVQHPSLDSLHAQAQAQGHKTLLDDGIQKVKAGVITLPELIRALL